MSKKHRARAGPSPVTVIVKDDDLVSCGSFLERGITIYGKVYGKLRFSRISKLIDEFSGSYNSRRVKRVSRYSFSVIKNTHDLY